MAHPGGGLSNHGYHADNGSNDQPKAHPNQVQLKINPNRNSAQYNLSQHDYEVLPFDRPKLNDPKVQLSSYSSIDNDQLDDYGYSVGGSIRPSVSTNGLDWDSRDSRAASTVSIIAGPRKRENPLYDSVGGPITYRKPGKNKPEPGGHGNNLRLLWLMLIIFMILTVILLVTVIVLIVMMTGNASKEELETYNSTVEAMKRRMTEMDTTIKQVTDPNQGGNENDALLIRKIQTNVTIAQDDIARVDSSLDSHIESSTANFTTVQTSLDGLNQKTDAVVSGIQNVETKTDNVRTEFNKFKDGLTLLACEYKTVKISGVYALKDRINSGIVTETDSVVVMSPKCSVGGPRMQDTTLRFEALTNDLSRLQYWCLCFGGADDATEVKRECRIHALLCKVNTAP